jgi:EAL domain-containing protein (putative c-di-GMP-specific phosphodiesterase class I)
LYASAGRQLRAWNRRFPKVPAFTVAVNISAKQFAQPDLVSQIDQMLSVSGLAPQSLKLELTESITMGDEKRTTRILGELKTLGVRLCIDDFATGYSSLSYLRRFAPDILKIDRSFVSDMLNKQRKPGNCEDDLEPRKQLEVGGGRKRGGNGGTGEFVAIAWLWICSGLLLFQGS